MIDLVLYNGYNRTLEEIFNHIEKISSVDASNLLLLMPRARNGKGNIVPATELTVLKLISSGWNYLDRIVYGHVTREVQTRTTKVENKRHSYFAGEWLRFSKSEFGFVSDRAKDLLSRYYWTRKDVFDKDLYSQLIKAFCPIGGKVGSAFHKNDDIRKCCYECNVEYKELF